MNSVFISSTFRDMHFERDILNRTVSTRLNHQLSEYNRSVRLLDLRWGVDTSDLSEEEATVRVLSVCFDSIESCRPYMVILLGDRYGYAPGADGISVTHMEILRGALETSDSSHIYIYCREADYTGMPEKMRSTYIEQNPAAMAKLKALKAELWQKLPQQCRRYQAHWSQEKQSLVSDDFESMVYEDLKKDLLDSLALKRYRSELHKQLSENDDILRDNLQHAYCNQAELNTRIHQVLTADKPFGLTGQAGAGKSVCMSLLCSALRSAGKDAYILFCGDNAFSASVRNTAETVLYCLTEASGEEYDFETNGLLSYEQLLQKILQQREKATGKTYILLDAVDKCEDGMFHFLLWCHRFLSSNVAIVFSSQNTEALEETAQSFTLSTIEYDSDALQEMALRLLLKHGKSLNSALISQLCQKAATPLQLHILLLRLMHQDSDDFAAIEKLGGGMNAINAHLQKLIAEASDNETEMLENYLLSLLDQSDHPQFDLLLLSFLVQSDHGLLETDLQHLMELATLPWVQMDYMDFLAEFAFFIRIRESGRLDISHDAIRRAFRIILQSQEKMICRMLCDHFFLSENTDAHTVTGFFRAAYRADQTQKTVAFLLRHNKVFSSLESADILLGRQIRKAVSDLLLQDDGHFLMGIFESCEDIEQLCRLQSMITSSMLQLNDYLSDSTAMQILQICLTVPIRFEFFPPDLALMELSSCEQFVQRHNFTDPDIPAFFEYCHKQLDIRSGQYGYAPPEAHIVQPDMIYADLTVDQNIAQQALVLEELSTMGRELATEPDCADAIKPLLLSLLQTVQENSLELPQMLQSIHIAGIYTSLGVLGKTTKNWEEGLSWDEKSAAVCKLLYEENPSPDMFRKYRARVYNVANLIEAWAMEEKTNIHLWQRTRDSYAQLYDLEIQAIAHGIPERELLQCASSILSYGTSLISCGDHDGGMEKFREGINLVLELTANNPRPELYLELSLHQMECVHQLCMVGQFRAALEFCTHIFQCTDLVLQQGTDTHKKSLWEHCASFLGHLSQLMAQLAQKQDLENILLLYRLQDNMYTVLLPTGSSDVKAGIMVTKRNIGNFLLHKQDYAGAVEAYLTLLKLVREKDLVQPDPMGHFNDRATLDLANVFVRSLLCLEQLGRNDAIKELLDTAPDWARFIATHTNCLQGDSPRVLYVMGADLSQQNSPLGMILVMLAFQEMQVEGYDIQAHRDTAVMILKAVEQIEKDLDNK